MQDVGEERGKKRYHYITYQFNHIRNFIMIL